MSRPYNIQSVTSTEEPVETPAVPPKKERDVVFDIAKGIGILLVLGHHTFGNSSRLYAASHSPLWWILTYCNEVLTFSVPVFLLVSSILYSRSLVEKPAIVPFYKRRIPGVLWPYFAWTGIYWLTRFVSDASARKIVPASLIGFHFQGPAMLVHVKERVLDIVWGKAFFHLYFLVILIGLIVVLPLAVKYVRWRKPGFYEVLIVSILVQGLILVAQHLTALLPYPASTPFWYIGSILPGAWIGMNWDQFKSKHIEYLWTVGALSVISGYLFLKEQTMVLHGLPADNYTSNGSAAAYSSCLSIVVLSASLWLANGTKAKNVLDLLGRNSLQIYLIHPGVLLAMERFRVVAICLGIQAGTDSYLGAVVSPVLMLALTFGLIYLFRVSRVEKALFGRTAA